MLYGPDFSVGFVTNVVYRRHERVQKIDKIMLHDYS